MAPVHTPPPRNLAVFRRLMERCSKRAITLVSSKPPLGGFIILVLMSFSLDCLDAFVFFDGLPLPSPLVPPSFFVLFAHRLRLFLFFFFFENPVVVWFVGGARRYPTSRAPVYSGCLIDCLLRGSRFEPNFPAPTFWAFVLTVFFYWPRFFKSFSHNFYYRVFLFFELDRCSPRS